MEPGDYVMKMLGAKDRGKKGLVISIVQGGPGNTLVEVLTNEGKTVHWPLQYLHLIGKGVHHG